jgi:hypothetical protein
VTEKWEGNGKYNGGEERVRPNLFATLDDMFSYVAGNGVLTPSQSTSSFFLSFFFALVPTESMR